MRLSKERRRVYNIYNIKEEDSKQRVSCFDNLELNSFPLSASLRISFRVSVSNKLSIIMTGLWAHFITRCLKVYLKECFSRCWSVVGFYERSFYWQSVINILFSPYFLSLARARSLYLPIYRDKKVTKSYIVCNYPLKHPWHVTLWPYLAPGYLIHGFALRTDPQAKTNLA